VVDCVVDGYVKVQCDQRLAVAGGVPIGRIETVALERLHQGEPIAKTDAGIAKTNAKVASNPSEIGTDGNTIYKRTADRQNAPDGAMTKVRSDWSAINASSPEDEAAAEAEPSTPETKAKSNGKVEIAKGDVIEVDLGRTHGWATAEVKRLRGKWLYYALTEQKPDKRKGKVQVIGRDILWRPVATAAPANP